MNPEIARRRSFAIISHPDAGKTTLTEKFLLYGGAIHLAGSVSDRKRQRATASDWMELERKRGISVNSTLLQFDYGGWRMNLLDTPGHKDFSEDTYRVLMAVDAVIMIIDAGKGIESQTRKLFEICSDRKIPIFTFMNKLDRPARPPLALIDEVESVLGIHAYPVNWPLGSGPDFRGVYDRLRKQVHLFEKKAGGSFQAPVSVHDLSDPIVAGTLEPDAYREAVEGLELLDGAHGGFDREAVLRGETTPVFFGSAVTNFGVQLLLEGFVEFSSPPAPRKAGERVVPVDDERFSGFVFKIQANMDPNHRDRVAFLRVCSGRFTRDTQVYHVRTGKKMRLMSSYAMFGQEREVVEEAYAGDVIGFAGKPDVQIGDTFSEDPAIAFDEIPRFAPECFAMLHNPAPAKYKPFRKGFEQLLAERVVQVFRLLDAERGPQQLLGAVGPLQFEVLQYRLKSEYGVDSRLEPQPWKILRWVFSDVGNEELARKIPYGAALAQDEQDRRVVLFPTDWAFEHFAREHPGIPMSGPSL